LIADGLRPTDRPKIVSLSHGVVGRKHHGVVGRKERPTDRPGIFPRRELTESQ